MTLLELLPTAAGAGIVAADVAHRVVCRRLGVMMVVIVVVVAVRAVDVADVGLFFLGAHADLRLTVGGADAWDKWALG
jgi:hypothetical protein